LSLISQSLNNFYQIQTKILRDATVSEHPPLGSQNWELNQAYLLDTSLCVFPATCKHSLSPWLLLSPSSLFMVITPSILLEYFDFPRFIIFFSVHLDICYVQIYSTFLFQIIRRFDIFRFIAFTFYLDVTFIQIRSKSYESRKAKTSYNLERKEQKLRI
jgi:hypothetical protein